MTMGKLPPMDSISVSEFKATCLAVIERVRRSGQNVVITKHGEPVAELVPARPPERKGRGFLGRMRGEFEIRGDIMNPVLSEAEWTGGLLDGASKKKTRRRRR
jgi:prevent-host-death family protein